MSPSPSTAAITDAVRRAMPSTTPTGAPSLGRAYLRSAAYRELRSSGWFEHRGPPPMDGRLAEGALSARELVSALRLRTYADLNPFSIDPKTVSFLAQPNLLAGLVQTVPTTRNNVELAAETSEAPVALSVDDGVRLPEPAIVFPGAAQLSQLKRFGAAWPITKDMLDQDGEVEALLDDRLQQFVGVGLEQGILGGTSSAMTGILNTPGLALLTKGDAQHAGEYDLDAILRAVETVQLAGYYTNPAGLAAVVHPTTLRLMRQAKDTATVRFLWDADVLADIGTWVPSRAMPLGQALVGDPFAGVGPLRQGPRGPERRAERGPRRLPDPRRGDDGGLHALLLLGTSTGRLRPGRRAHLSRRAVLPGPGCAWRAALRRDLAGRPLVAIAGASGRVDQPALSDVPATQVLPGWRRPPGDPLCRDRNLRTGGAPAPSPLSTTVMVWQAPPEGR